MNTIPKMQLQLQDFLYIHGDIFFPNHKFSEVYKYSIFPTGKLFRPMLALASYIDAQEKDNNYDINCKDNISFLCSALEVHHTYTLMHDDLPCMDNDKERRGRPSSHVQFNQWKALLAGDGLLNMSYGLMAQINHANSSIINKVFSWCLGPKGLIQGQVLDLTGEITKSFESIVQTHTLKTSRLIQVSLIAGLLCSDSIINRKKTCDMARIGQELGLLFQFLDDLSELSEQKISEHEVKVNPWLHYFQDSLNQTIQSFIKTKLLLKEYQLRKTLIVIDQYLEKMVIIFQNNEKQILKNIKKYNRQAEISLAPLMSLF